MSAVLLRCRTHNRGDQARPIYFQQFRLDTTQKRAMRDIRRDGDTLQKTSWTYTPRPFEEGLYCAYCLQEGKREPFDLDEEDLRELGLYDPPLVFQAAKDVDIERLLESLREKYGEMITYVQELPEQAAHYDESNLLGELHPGIRRMLCGPNGALANGGKLYSFQARAVRAALDGNDMIVTTPTASGKTLTYTLPVLDGLLRDRSATALYISPLVALTEDQLDSLSRFDSSGTDWQAKSKRFSHYGVLRTLDTGSGSVTVARYDGSVNKGDRQLIREARPQYLLTTPDMLHAAILGGAFDDRRWRSFFQGLRYVVIDELHSYRGVMGAAFANLLRRLQRICRLHGTEPRFLCASATIVDPAQSVERLIGRSPIVIDAALDGAPQNKRAFVLWNSAGTRDQSANALSTHAKNALLYLLRERVRSIAFLRSISEINDVYRFTRAELAEQGINEAILQPFMRELLTEDKREIIRDVKQGRLNAVLSTNALSMGIDIGSLSAALIIGFPGSIAQLWQQAGRAGRSGQGLVILVAASNPLDQFFVDHPEVLFNLQAEPLYCNPDNPYIVRSHLLRAAQETRLQQHEIAAFGVTASAILEELCAEGLLVSDAQQGWQLTSLADTVVAQPFRNIAFSIPVMTTEQKVIVEVDSARAQRALHKYAHYQHIDRYYRVIECELNWRTGSGKIEVQELEKPEYTTTARLEQQIAIKSINQSDAYQAIGVATGIIQCHTQVVGYYKVPLFARNEKFEFQPLGRAAPDPLIYDTQAFWLTCDADLLNLIPVEEQLAGLTSLAGALRIATSIVALCDPSDIAVVATAGHPDTGLPTVLLYDVAPGGIGISEAAYKQKKQVLERAKLILADCPYCSKHPDSRGCPHCVTAPYGDETSINRTVALSLVEACLIYMDLQ